MDLRTDVLAASGILPGQYLNLPPGILAHALENMELLFRVGPFIGSTEDLRLPLPEDVGGKWFWYADHQGYWQLDEKIGKKETIPAVASKPLQIHEGWIKLGTVPENE